MVGTPLAQEGEAFPSVPSGVIPRQDRRRQLRFPIVLHLHYLLKSGDPGDGLLVNIGSGGLFFRCASRLPVGKPIEVAIPWPFLLDGDCPLQLRVRGRITRSDGSTAAVAIQRYEFHTAARQGQASVRGMLQLE